MILSTLRERRRWNSDEPEFDWKSGNGNFILRLARFVLPVEGQTGEMGGWVDGGRTDGWNLSVMIAAGLCLRFRRFYI